MLSSSEIRYLNTRLLAKEVGGLSALADRIDRQQPQVSSFAGDNPSKNIGSRMARYIEQCFSRPEMWLDTPHPELWDTENKHQISEPIPFYGEAKPVPVVGMAQLGPEGFWEETQHPVGHGDGNIIWPTRDENAYSIRCVGDSMKPRIRHGEYVVVEPNHTIIPGDEVLVKTSDGQCMIKVFLYERDDRIHLDSVNNHFAQIAINKSDITKLHYVAGIAKAALHRI